MKKISDLILLIFLIVFSFLFIFSQLQFELFWLDLLNQLVFQLYLGGIFLLLLIIILKKYKSLIIIVPICIILGYQSLLPCKKCLNYIDVQIDYSSKISLLTYNTSYNFNKFDFKKLEDFIVSNNIDILVFQEVSPEFQSNLKKLQNYNFSHNLNENLNFWDTLIMTRFPLNTSKKVKIFTEIQINKQNTKIHIIGTHIYPPINQSLYLASTKQLEELEHMITIDKSNLIVAGDLNNSSVSRRFRDLLEKTNLYSGISLKNITNTWPSFLPNILGIQIDHVIFSKNFKLKNKKTLDFLKSDHKPLFVEIVY